MTEGKVLTYVSEAAAEGLEILKVMKDLLSNEERRHPYSITDIQLLEDKGKIDFNFHWIKLFLKFRLHGDYRTHGGGEGESIQFIYPLIWGRYDISQNGIEIETPIVEESKIQGSPGEISPELVYNGSHCPFEQIDRCLRVFDQIIFKCLPESVVKIDNLELT